MACSEHGATTSLVDYRPQSTAGRPRGATWVDTDTAGDDAAIQQQIGAAIRERRTTAGLTQATLAERAGIHRTYLNQVEHGHKAATTVVLVHLARALNTSAATLLRGIA